MEPAPELLLSIHVPKSAGSTLQKVLAHWFPPEQRLIVHEEKEPAWRLDLPESDKLKLRLVHGHFTFGAHESFRQPLAYMCFLRNPLERLASLYYFILSNGRHPRHHLVADSGMSLRDFAGSGISPEIENGQLRMLVARPDAHFIRGSGPCVRADLDQALANLDRHFLHVGITEEFDSSVQLLGHRLGKSVPHYERKNVNRHRQPLRALDRATISALERANEFDLELYEAGLRRFREQWAALGLVERARLGVRAMLPRRFRD